ncbi:MAG: hypothetical protein J6D27_01305 [Ruminiclostridium sp.]|nr:hypothetical protein [Ruminiclostridium sp.]
MSLKIKLKRLKENYVINQAQKAKLPELSSDEICRQRITFSGRVQNVGFRLEVVVLPKSKGTEATSAKMTAKSGESLAITSVPKVRIPQPRKIVNPDNKNSLPETDSKGNKLTEQQREYFKDRKLVENETDFTSERKRT